MPPKQQKRKPTKKPVNRGFATTSIPKKVSDPDPQESPICLDPSLDGNEPLTGEPTSTNDLSGSKSCDPNQPSVDQGDPGKLTVAHEEWEQDSEEREIQSLAERLKPVCEKEITKQLKILENDKRFAKGWSGFRLSDSSLQASILEYARKTQPAIDGSGLKQSNTPCSGLQEYEEKLVQKLVTLHSVLDGLGFKKYRIRECLEEIKALEFEDAMDYLVLNCSNEELISAGFDGLSNHESSSGPSEKDSETPGLTVKTPQTAAFPDDQFNAVDVVNDKLNLLPELSTDSIEQPSNLTVEPTDSDIGLRIDLSSSKVRGTVATNCSTPSLKAMTLERQQALENEEAGSVDDSSDAIEDYVTLKLSIIELSKKNSKLGTSHLKGKALKDAAKVKKEVKLVEDKVKLIQASYAFSQKRADEALKAKLKEMKNGHAARNVTGDRSLDGASSTTHERSPPPSPVLPITAIQSLDDEGDEIEPADEASTVEPNKLLNSSSNGNPSTPSATLTISFNGENSPSINDLVEAESENDAVDFEMMESTLEEPALLPQDQVGPTDIKKTPSCTVTIVRDMPLPKQFSGKTPQSLLEEALRRWDKFAQPQYLVISRGSRAVRASVEIKWSSRKVIPTQTGKISSISSKLSTHTIQTFTMADEACRDETQAYNYVATLALFHLNTGNLSTTHRFLPATFRELWDELDEKRKKEDDQKYLDQIRSLVAIAKHRASLSSNIPGEQPQSKALTSNSSDETSKSALPQHHQPDRMAGDLYLMEDFAMRQHWHSYQIMLTYRASLPIAVYRSIIVSAVEQNQVLLLCGETGCGKSTQLPAFILEHELANGRPVKIFCTQPRRISAISLAERVSQELGEPAGAVGQVGSLVGYNIRLESKTSITSRLIYATTGVVLRMLENATDLQDITHLILDEIHERSIDSDFLLIALKTILERRPNLRVILMSATVDAEKISSYMNNCPILKVPGRTFPVTSFFLEDVIELTDYRLDPQSDSPYVARRGKRKPVMLKTASLPEDIPSLDDEDEATGQDALAHTYAPSTRATLEVLDEHQINMDLIVLLLLQICWQNPALVQRFSSAILIFLPSLDSIRKLTELLESHPFFGTESFQIFPLHSSISNENQSLVFQVPPRGVRKIVISTNIAETGVTIPDVTCVIDSGKHKEMRYDEKRQISKLVETFIAKSNVTQRKGRAGRVQEGICFHLFTKHRMETYLADNPLPEMLRLSLQDLALRIKIMKIGTSIEEVLLQALDPPSTANVQRAIASLVEVKALTPTEEITPLGRHLVKLPMDVHLGKLLILGCLFRCLSPALTIAAALNSKSPFLTPFGREQEADAIRKSFKVENSDFLTICKVYNSWRQAYLNDHVHQFCRKNMLSLSNLLQIEDLRVQFFGFLADAGFVDVDSQYSSTHSFSQRNRFCNVPPELDLNADQHKLVMGCVGAAMFPKLLVRDGTMQVGNVNSNTQGGWRTLTNSAPAVIHPSSVNFSSGRRPDFGEAKFVTYFNIMQSKKLYIWESGVVNEKAIFLLCGEADFKIPAQSVIIDRKIKASMNPKTLLTVKLLRQKFQQLLNLKMKNPTQRFNEHQQRWFDMITAVIKDEKESIKLNKNDSTIHPTTNHLLPKTASSSKNRMSLVLAPAGRTLNTSQNLHNDENRIDESSKTMEVGSQNLRKFEFRQDAILDPNLPNPQDPHLHRTTLYETSDYCSTSPSTVSTYYP